MTASLLVTLDLLGELKCDLLGWTRGPLQERSDCDADLGNSQYRSFFPSRPRSKVRNHRASRLKVMW